MITKTIYNTKINYLPMDAVEIEELNNDVQLLMKKLNDSNNPYYRKLDKQSQLINGAIEQIKEAISNLKDVAVEIKKSGISFPEDVNLPSFTGNGTFPEAPALIEVLINSAVDIESTDKTITGCLNDFNDPDTGFNLLRELLFAVSEIDRFIDYSKVKGDRAEISTINELKKDISGLMKEYDLLSDSFIARLNGFKEEYNRLFEFDIFDPIKGKAYFTGDISVFDRTANLFYRLLIYLFDYIEFHYSKKNNTGCGLVYELN